MRVVISRWPRIGIVAQHVYRRFQPRFTVGAVGILISNDQKVLLVEHVFHAVHPWGLPGGWVDDNELPQRAVEREFLEETGLAVECADTLAIWSSTYWHNHLDLAFLVKLIGDLPLKLTLSSELLNYQWAHRTDLPPVMAEHRQAIELGFAMQKLRANEAAFSQTTEESS